LLIAAYLRIHDCDVGWFSFHAARDLYRAQCILTLHEIPLWGSELQYGGRTLGPFVYLIYAIPLAIKCSTYSVALFIALYNIFTIFLAYIFIRHYFGAKAAIFASVFYACFPLEISQIRYFWNPTFLPLMVLLFFWGIYLLTIKDREWGLVLSVFSFFMAFNVHFSAIDVFPILILALFLKKVKISRKIWAITILLVLIFILPPVVGSLTSRFTNVKEIIKAPYARKSAWNRIRFNPNATVVFTHHLRFTYHERGEHMGFVYLGFVREYLESIHREVPSWMPYLEKLGYIQLIFWILGFGTAIVRGFNFRKISAFLGHFFDTANYKAYMFLVPWQILPWLVLSFFNYHYSDAPKSPSIIAIRYFLVVYPATFITMGLGVSTMVNYLERHCMILLKRFLYFLLLILLTGQTAFAIYHVNLMKESGKSLPYAGYCPNQREMQKTSLSLIHYFRLHPEDFYSRVFSTGVYTWYRGECSLDWHITQNAEAWQNPRMPDDRYIILYEDKDKNLPFSPNDIMLHKRFKDVNIALIKIPQGGGMPKLDNSKLINYWIKRMVLLMPAWQR
jgi:hypothetical protein